MTDLSISENVFLNYVAAIDGIESYASTEPVRLGKLPSVTMLFVSAPAEDRETGSMYVNYTYKVNLYISLTSLETAQASMKTILPQLLAITRKDPHLNNTCVWADLNDRGDEPVFLENEGALQKSLYLTVGHYESIT